MTALALLMFQIGWCWRYPYLDGVPQSSGIWRAARWIGIVALGLVATYGLDLALRTRARECRLAGPMRKVRFALLIGIGVGLKCAVPFASPYPSIDVWQMWVEETAALWRGANPYTTPIRDIYHNLQGSQYSGFVYFPFSLIWVAPFHVILGDTRFGLILAEFIGVCALWRWSRRALGGNRELLYMAELVLVTFLLQSQGLFIIEMSWSEPLLVGLLALALTSGQASSRSLFADVCWGVFWGAKQTALGLAPSVIGWWKRSWARYAAALSVLGLLLLPFILWDSGAFYANVVRLHWDYNARPDLLSLQSWTQRMEIAPVRRVGPAIGLAVSCFFAWRLARWQEAGYALALSASYGLMFLTGTLGAVNYYYLVGALQLMAALLLARTLPSRDRTSPGTP